MNFSKTSNSDLRQLEINVDMSRTFIESFGDKEIIKTGFMVGSFWLLKPYIVPY